MKVKIIACLLAVLPFTAGAQQLRSSYVDWGVRGSDFPGALQNWEKGMKWCDDDNFFISRVRPKTRFRNNATQVNPALNEENDKKLIYWVPINNETFNALPDGVYDSEVFPMWSYITHYGNWSSRLIRIPGNFSDVAHKHGVPVSAVASVPYGTISSEWKNALVKLAECGGKKVADYLEYYGVDGIGYNSEFSTAKSVVTGLQQLHEDIIKELRGTGRNPLAEIIWYDGTNDNGAIAFDRGLRTGHNVGNWGYGDEIRSSLFFNYNWNNRSLLQQSVETAAQYGRTPLDLYCGINMQGKEPKTNINNIWTLLKDWNLSIGLWGAHSQNMFFESRAEKGPKPDSRQRAYLQRLEKWFTGGTRNPVNDIEINNSLKIAADNDSFFGMSKMMSARSSLKWDLSEEPFISYFNLGNGKFFNYNGLRCHNSEWYNIGIQDYMPTWMWWFSKSFMGRTASDVAVGGLNAEFVWDDAWMGGSLLRINGTSDSEYLHLFKTEFPLVSGDKVTARYKIVNGTAEAALVMSAKGSESVESAASVMTPSEKDGCWIEKTFTIGKDFASLAGKEVAMIALYFKNARNLDLRLGEISIVRPGVTSRQPAKPVIEKAEILSARSDGADAKIIFNMPNDKGNGICYNTDVNTSLFKLYAREEGKKPVLMGMTTSWAGLLFSIPGEYSKGKRLSIGVSAMSLDMKVESETAWSEPLGIDDVYEVSDKVALSKPVIKPGEAFKVAYVDNSHQVADWTIVDSEGRTVASETGSLSIDLEEGLQEIGKYTVRVKGVEHKDGKPVESTREFIAMIQITSEESGNIPSLLSADVDGKTENEISLPAGTESAVISFTGKSGEAALSRGVRVGESGMGFRFAETHLPVDKSFSVSFWLKPDDFSNKAAHILNIRDKGDKWANNNWGWFWHTVNENGVTDAFTLRMNSGGNVNYRFDDTRIEPGVWHHFAYIFDFDSTGKLKVSFFLDGQQQQVTSWTRNDVAKSGEVTYQGTPYTWRSDNVVAVGGFLHNSGSVCGNLDNLMLWNKALDASGVKISMSDIDSENIPEDLVSLFDFEKDFGKDLTFTSVGSVALRGGSHDYEATEVEGQGTLKWVKPEYCAGAPMLSGKTYQMKTVAEFFNYGGSVTDVNGDNEAGSGVLHFPGEGKYQGGIILRNEYGADTRRFTIKVGNPNDSNIEEFQVSGFTVTPTLFDTFINVKAPSDGYYRVSLVTMEGQKVIANDFNVKEGETMRIYPEVPVGLYLVLIEKDGKIYGTERVVKK